MVDLNRLPLWLHDVRPVLRKDRECLLHVAATSAVKVSSTWVELVLSTSVVSGTELQVCTWRKKYFSLSNLDLNLIRTTWRTMTDWWREWHILGDKAKCKFVNYPKKTVCDNRTFYGTFSCWSGFPQDCRRRFWLDHHWQNLWCLCPQRK